MVRSVSVLVIAATVLAVHPALAKDSAPAAAAKQLLAAQVAAIAGGDASALAAAFDDGAYAVFPTTAEASGRAEIERLGKIWLASLGKLSSVKAARTKVGAMGATGCAWIVTEIVIAGGATPARLRVTELVTPKANTTGDYRILAAHLSEPAADKAVLAAAGSGALPTLPAISGGAPARDELDSPVAMARYLQISADPAVALIGSAPTELVTGKAGVAAKVRAWKSLAMTASEHVGLADTASMGAASASIWHVTVTYQVAGKPVVVPYRVHVITLGQAPGNRGPTYLCAVHFSVALR